MRLVLLDKVLQQAKVLSIDNIRYHLHKIDQWRFDLREVGLLQLSREFKVISPRNQVEHGSRNKQVGLTLVAPVIHHFHQ